MKLFIVDLLLQLTQGFYTWLMYRRGVKVLYMFYIYFYLLIEHVTPSHLWPKEPKRIYSHAYLFPRLQLNVQCSDVARKMMYCTMFWSKTVVFDLVIIVSWLLIKYSLNPSIVGLSFLLIHNNWTEFISKFWACGFSSYTKTYNEHCNWNLQLKCVGCSINTITDKYNYCNIG